MNDVSSGSMATFKEVEISSLGNLLDQATPQQCDPVSGRRRVNAIYRGVADTRWSLLTSLDRLGGPEPPHTKAHLEEHILRNFMRYARPFLQQPNTNHWELLVTAQHHGAPTRLLDWTFSPLIAAHFATLRGQPDCDRVIWRLDWLALHEHFRLKPLAFLVSDLDEALQSHGYASAWDLFNSEREGKPFVCMLEPPALDARILAQSAAFTLASVKTMGLDQILEQNALTQCLTRFIIRAEKVDFIRDQLDLCGIDERKIFPDIDGVAAEIARYYSASGGDSNPR
ncbi:MAG: hypothetical protein JWM68_3139 [Verrucomicrobiales bacterium]|nr:hypothetical protein [Verrucomicrobiales bacterium]